MKGVTRPDVFISPEGAVVPPTNLISPAPNKFTHEVNREQPFFYSEKFTDTPPSGQFEPGTKVNLLFHDGGEMCRVVDGRGLYVLTACGGLRPIEK
jgi:hypothetical protein